MQGREGNELLVPGIPFMERDFQIFKQQSSLPGTHEAFSPASLLPFKNFLLDWQILMDAYMPT